MILEFGKQVILLASIEQRARANRLLDRLKVYFYIVKDRYFRTLRGCGVRHNYEMYPPHVFFPGGAAIVEFKCSRCGDWYNEIQGWQNMFKPE